MSGSMAFCPSEPTWPPGHSCPTCSTKALFWDPHLRAFPWLKNKVYSEGNKEADVCLGVGRGLVVKVKGARGRDFRLKT